jgi:hypothetical protein
MLAKELADSDHRLIRIATQEVTRVSRRYATQRVTRVESRDVSTQEAITSGVVLPRRRSHA